MTANVPDGFQPLKMRANPFIDPLGPLYGRREGDGLVIGLPIERRHCNPGGSCHGGMMMTLSDMLLILNANAQSGIAQFMLTVNLTCDFVGPANEGEWLEGRATMLRASPRMVFVHGLFTTGDKLVARCNGIFKPTGETNKAFSFAEQFPAGA
ncbi:MAG: PaaI family thioesterase [Burkholderiaceae bacterium]